MLRRGCRWKWSEVETRSPKLKTNPSFNPAISSRFFHSELAAILIIDPYRIFFSVVVGGADNGNNADEQ